MISKFLNSKRERAGFVFTDSDGAEVGVIAYNATEPEKPKWAMVFDHAGARVGPVYFDHMEAAQYRMLSEYVERIPHIDAVAAQ